jgi:hypothetical protein
MTGDDRARAERLAADLGVTVEVRRPAPRAHWRVYVDSAPADGRRYGGSHADESFAWTSAARALRYRAECLTRDVHAADDRSRCATRARKDAAAGVVEAERALSEKRAALARAEAVAREATAELDDTLAGATDQQRAAWAALTQER